jgi:hypothetical protein
MGISQLECLQLRRLVGPTGIGAVSTEIVGNDTGSVNVAQITLNLSPDGTAQGGWTSPFTVPSGTGVMRVQVQTSTSGGSALYYRIVHAGTNSVGLPTDILPGGSVAAEGLAGWYYQGLMYYSNPSSTPAPITLTVGTQGSVQVCNLMCFSVRTISFGPYVNQA